MLVYRFFVFELIYSVYIIIWVCVIVFVFSLLMPPLLCVAIPWPCVYDCCVVCCMFIVCLFPLLSVLFSVIVFVFMCVVVLCLCCRCPLVLFLYVRSVSLIWCCVFHVWFSVYLGCCHVPFGSSVLFNYVFLYLWFVIPITLCVLCSLCSIILCLVGCVCFVGFSFFMVCPYPFLFVLLYVVLVWFIVWWFSVCLVCLSTSILCSFSVFQFVSVDVLVVFISCLCSAISLCCFVLCCLWFWCSCSVSCFSISFISC